MNETTANLIASSRDGKQRESHPVDRGYLSGFTLGNQLLERKLLNMFAQQSMTDFGILSEATTIEDWRNAAHNLKNSAFGIGAWQIASLAGAAEGLNCDPSDPRRDALLLSVERMVHEANSFIQAILETE